MATREDISGIAISAAVIFNQPKPTGTIFATQSVFVVAPHNAAREMVDKTIKDWETVRGITEEPKAKDPFTWISAMEQIKHTAEEIVFNDLIYKL